jgi:hypothetical protein
MCKQFGIQENIQKKYRVYTNIKRMKTTKSSERLPVTGQNQLHTD